MNRLNSLLKIFLVAILIGNMTTEISAQYSLSGVVEFDGSSLPGAEVQVFKMGTTERKNAVAEENGVFKIDNLAAGNYRMTISYLGFKKFKKRITIDKDLNLGNITMEEDIVEIDGVEIKGSMIQAIQKGDTTVFNADAFKTLPDADAKDLIAKLPGIVMEGGTVQANGEDVQKVTVDGREFFGTDPNVALNALPAEVIERIEIIDEQSEQSQFTGFNDGNTTKTINIVTKPDKRNGEFGKIYGGYGIIDNSDDSGRYQLGGNINIFNGDRRISLIGLSNNINVQNFSTDDLLGVVGSQGRRGGRRGNRGRGGVNDFLIGQQDGISTTNSMGLNWSEKFGEKVDFSGSYFFNNSETQVSQIIERTFFDVENNEDVYFEVHDEIADNTNHKANARLRVDFNDKNRLTISPRFSWQGNNYSEYNTTEFLRRSGFNTFSENETNAENSGINFTNRIQYRHSMAKKGRTITLGLKQSMMPKDGSSNLISSTQSDTTETTTIDQNTSEKSSDYGWGAELSYTEPLSESSRMMLDYEIERDWADDEEFTFEPLSSSPISSLSNDQISEELVNTFGAGYQWRKDKTSITARARVQHTQISSDQILPSEFVTNKSYLKVLPFVMARMQLSENKNLRVYYRPRTNNPSASQLSETIDNSNPQQLSKGNINLDQSFQHRLFARFSATDKMKGTVFYLFLGGDYSNDYITDQTYLSGRDNALYETLNLDDRSQLTLPINLQGYYNLRSYVTIGIPVSMIKSKLNFNISGNYGNTPSKINENINDSKSVTLGFGVSLTSNISNKIDFTISSKTSIGDVSNSLQSQLDNQYLSQLTGLKLDVIFPYGITWRNDVGHQIYNGYGEGFNDSYLLANMSIGKKFLKNNRAEISLSVFDLFNQNLSINRNIGSTYIENVETNVLQRYFMVNFRYDLRHFGTQPKQSNDFKREGRDRRGRF